ncbi:MAG TPA: DUF1893 domain-containing protein [Clostridiales bacterium]|nr:DUF1893 domain-containing protein [Clostridiales bacterium]
MDYLKLAREIMYNENQKIVIVNNNEIIYKNDGFGIKPLYCAYMRIKDQMKGASCADRVIGKAAAWIYKEAGIKELYCDVITTRAKNLLLDSEIEVAFVEEVDYIENRDKTGMCPVETLAKDETDFDNLLKNIEKFLIEKNLM